MNPAPSTDESAIFDIGWCLQRSGGVDMSFFHGHMTEASFERFREAACRSIDERDDSERIAQLQEVRDPVMMNGKWRTRMASALDARADKLARTCPAYAMVTDSMVVRAALKVMFWAAPPPHPYTVVPTLAEACEFIAHRVPHLDPVELQRKHERMREAALAASAER